MIVSAQAVAAALASYLAAGGDETSGPAVMSTLAIGMLADLGAMARGYDVGEAVIEAERCRAVTEDRAAWARPRGGLRAVP